MPGLREIVDEPSWTQKHASSRGDDEASARREELARATAGSLMRTIEVEVIPRLLLVHGVMATGPRWGGSVTRTDVESLTSQLLSRSEPNFDLFLAEIEGRGVGVEAICLDLLAPSARLLGIMWEQDLVEFTDVTVGLSRLQRLLHQISARFEREEDHPVSWQTILLTATPGEQHTFGLSLVWEFFRRAGWDVCDEMPETGAQVTEFSRRRWLSAIGFSLSSEVLLDRLASVIRDVRVHSRNRDIGILVGGSVFQGHPEWVASVGADATALDGRQAVVQAQSLCRLMATKSR